MNYYIDTEFLEGTQTNGQPWFNFWLGPKAKEKPTIDLISIGIAAEDGREYYAISKDFNLKEAWNRYDWYSTAYNKPARNKEEQDFKVYWIRENVLKPIFDQWNKYSYHTFNFSNFKYCIDCIGKTNQQIAEEVKEFTLEVPRIQKHGKPKFYGYYCDYDWVAFCWLFGKMIDLPNGFPMYCRDLKQMLDEAFLLRSDYQKPEHHPNYPKQTNEHNALADARWNKKLHEFIKTL